MLLNISPRNSSSKKMTIFGVIVLHAIFFWFLKHFQGVPAASYLTLMFSAAALTIYYSGLVCFPLKIWAGIFAGILVLQPVWVLHAYALNAREFASVLPSMHVTPVFNWVRPLKAPVDNSRIYQFVHYEDFWYDMSMTDAPPKVGYLQSVTRWTFDLSEHTPENILATYAQYKIIIYDGLGSVGKPVKGPGSDLDVKYFDVNTLRLKSNFNKPETVVYNDSYTTSWKAFIDGNAVELLRVNTAFKGIKVPEGEHEIEFLYRPPGGRWVYFAATGALFIYLFWAVLMLYWRV
jgi:hypothetical protein